MKTKNVLLSVILLLLGMPFTTLNAQATPTLRYVSGFCNKVEATIFNNVSKVYEQQQSYGYCSSTGTYRPKSDHSKPRYKYIFQLQKLVNGTFVDQGSGHGKDTKTTIYRDLQYGQTYRVKILLQNGNGVTLYHPSNPCWADAQKPGIITEVFTNPLEIVQYNQFDDNDMSGILQSTPGFGGNGSSFVNRRKYCQQDVSGTDVNYDVSGTFGADHWAINLERTNMTGGWAGGVWHDYEPTTNVDVFGEGWLGKYGSSAIWPGQYTITFMGHQDCDNAQWASQNDYFEIVATGQQGCRVEVGNDTKDVVVYPNPNTTGQLQYYTTGEEMEQLDYIIYNMNGQVVEKGLAYGGAGELDISSLKAGMYTITFATAKETVSKRISVIK